MARILDIQKRSNQYLADFDVNVIGVIEAIGQQTVDFNRAQMLAHKDADGKPLIHKRTGVETLSKAYAKKTGKTKPDLYVSGAFQDAMFLVMQDIKDYTISSDDALVQYLPGNYGKIFGVDLDNQPKAQDINDKAIIDDYMKSVFQ